MTDIYDGIGQKINVGDFVAMAHGSYVQQLFGFVTKLGNKGNARVSRGSHEGQFIDASGLIVINSVLSKLSQEQQGKYAAMKVEASQYFTNERPKSSKAPKYRVYINDKTGLGYVISFQTQDEMRQKVAKIDTGYDTSKLRRVKRNSWTVSGHRLTFSRYGSTRSEVELPFRVIKELDLISFIDFEDGFDYTTTELNKLFV